MAAVPLATGGVLRADLCGIRSPEDVEDVRREVQIMHHLAGHPHITRLKGAYEDRGSVHIVRPPAAAQSETSPMLVWGMRDAEG